MIGPAVAATRVGNAGSLDQRFFALSRAAGAGGQQARARWVNASRNLGSAKSTKALTLGTESRPYGDTRCTGNGSCSSSARMMRSEPSATASARWYENMRTMPRP